MNKGMLALSILRKTYDRMEKISQQLWTMQRYRIMEYILAESVQPGPFLIYSLAYQLIMLIIRPEVHKGFRKQQAFRKNCLVEFLILTITLTTRREMNS